MMNKTIVAVAIVACTSCARSTGDGRSIDSEQTEQPTFSSDFELQGHRGARGLYPENTIPGFLAALDLQVNTLELDVVISKDGKVVVSHEPWISSVICWNLHDRPVPEGRGLNIYQMTYDEVSNYNCGSQPHPDFPQQAKIPAFKPLLGEVISECEAFVHEKELPAVWYNIEIKSTPDGDGAFHPAPKEFVRVVLDVVKAGGISERTIIQSFDVRALQQLKEQAPNIPVALLIADSKGFERDLEELGFVPEIYSPHFKLVNNAMVRNCRDNGIRIIPWTVNEEDDMIELLEMGVDGIITDYPDLALTLKM